MRLPTAYENKMKELLGDSGYEAYLRSFDTKQVRGIRLNTAKVSTEEFEKISPFSCKKVAWVPNGYSVDDTKGPDAEDTLSRESVISKHPYYAAGLYYIQEPSAMTPAAVLPVEEGDKILDLCAAPGGKATQIAARLHGTGLLVANDYSNSRAKALLKNLELSGSPNILVTSESPERLSKYFPEFFDKILIDAPCSGEGMFRRDPDMVKSWEEKGPAFYAELQSEITDTAVSMLKPGGYMVYSTCTFDLSENEGTLYRLMQKHPEIKVVPVSEEMNKVFEESGFVHGFDYEDIDFSSAYHIFPHLVEGEGHFVALLKKDDENTKDVPPDRKVDKKRASDNRHGADNKRGADKKDGDSLVMSFLHENMSTSTSLPIEEYSLDIRGEDVYLLPAGLPSLKGLRFLRTGLYLGQLLKKRFEPSQAFAMCLKTSDYKYIYSLSSDDLRVDRYLKGETIEPDEQTESGEVISLKEGAWYLICADNYPLGWAKCINGSLRNKYYPGWRKA